MTGKLIIVGYKMARLDHAVLERMCDQAFCQPGTAAGAKSTPLFVNKNLRYRVRYSVEKPNACIAGKKTCEDLVDFCDQVSKETLSEKVLLLFSCLGVNSWQTNWRAIIFPTRCENTTFALSASQTIEAKLF